MNPDLDDQPLTAQLGDKTYAGVWGVRGETVLVRCAHGEAAARLNLWTRPIAVAERLLIQIHRQGGQL